MRADAPWCKHIRVQGRAVVAITCVLTSVSTVTLIYADPVLALQQSRSLTGTAGGSAASATRRHQFSLGEVAVGASSGSAYRHTAGFWGLGAMAVSGVETVPAQLPVANRLVLAPISPNPSRSGFSVRYTLSIEAGEMRFLVAQITDIAGRSVRQLVLGPQSAGVHTFTWNGRTEEGRSVPAGIYFLTLASPDARQTIRFVVIP